MRVPLSARLLLLATLGLLPSCVRSSSPSAAQRDGGGEADGGASADATTHDATIQDIAPPDVVPSPDLVDLCAAGRDAGGSAPFAAGDGTIADPYVICDAVQLAGIGSNPGLLGAHFVLYRDVDLANVPFTEIGSDTAPFRGSFDGRGHVIANLALGTTPTMVRGMFRSTEGARIHDLRLENAVVGNSSALVHQAGALVGLATDTAIERVTASVTVWGGDTLGGLVGRMTGGKLRDIRVSGTVEMGVGSDGVGGVVGELSDVEVARVGTTVKVHCLGADPFGVSAVGGLAGYADNTSFTDVYARAEVSFDDLASVDPRGVGGLIGDITGGEVNHAYATGPVKTGGTAGACFAYASAQTTLEGVFFDSDTMGVAAGGAEVGLSTAELQTPSVLTAAGFSTAVWRLVPGRYPELL